MRLHLFTDAEDIVAEIRRDHPNPVEKASLAIIQKSKDKTVVANMWSLIDSAKEKRIGVEHIIEQSNIWT